MSTLRNSHNLFIEKLYQCNALKHGLKPKSAMDMYVVQMLKMSFYAWTCWSWQLNSVYTLFTKCAALQFTSSDCMCTMPPEQVSTYLSQLQASGRQIPFPTAAVEAEQGVEYCIFTDLNQTTAQNERMGQLFFSLLHSWKSLSHLKLKEEKKEVRSLRHIVEF